jgi:hypothetical protein
MGQIRRKLARKPLKRPRVRFRTCVWIKWGGPRRGAGRPPGYPKTGGRKKGTPNKIGWHLLESCKGIATLKAAMKDKNPMVRLRANNFFLRAVVAIVRYDDD